MNIPEIKNLEELIPLENDSKIIAHKITRLTAPGDNYGSLILSLVLTVQNQRSTTDLHTVAKTVPPNEFLQKLFDTPVTFRLEIIFYKHLIPLLKDFQKENGVKDVIDFTPKFFGGRLNLSGTDTVDPDAALVLENLKLQNYQVLDKRKGMDFETSKMVLSELARLHAVPLALKLQKPDTFIEKIVPYMRKWEPLFESLEIYYKALDELSEKIDELKPYNKRILQGYVKCYEIPQVTEPFATVVHNDLWTNNVMVQFEDHKPKKVKIIDFQGPILTSPAKDIVFFLYSSVINEVLEEKYDELVRWYHQNFIQTLEELHCDTSKFNFEALEKEIENEAINSQFGHIVFMLFPIFDEHVSDMDKLKAEKINIDCVSQLQKDKFTFVVKQFVKKNWI